MDGCRAKRVVMVTGDGPHGAQLLGRICVTCFQPVVQSPATEAVFSDLSSARRAQFQQTKAANQRFRGFAAKVRPLIPKQL